MKTRIFLSILILAPLLIVNKNAFVMAQEDVSVPTFPTCQMPQGEVKAFYQQGTHGIPGSTAEYTGTDAVYSLTEETLAQCFCPLTGDGIQTNWWKVSDLTIEQIENLAANGWIYIPNGAEWGLEETPYLAKNQTFVCAGGIGGPIVPDNRANRHNNNNDSDNDNDDDQDEVQEETTNQQNEVLGGMVLAGTGNTRTIVLYFAIALAFSSAAWVSYKKHAKTH